jgi:hypothetical protein
VLRFVKETTEKKQPGDMDMKRTTLRASLVGSAAAGLIATALATPAFAQATTYPAGTDCSTLSNAANRTDCMSQQNESRQNTQQNLQQPGTPAPGTPAVGTGGAAGAAPAAPAAPGAAAGTTGTGGTGAGGAATGGGGTTTP